MVALFPVICRIASYASDAVECRAAQGSAVQMQDPEGRRRMRESLRVMTESDTGNSPLSSVLSSSHVNDSCKYRITHEKSTKALQGQDSNSRRREVPKF